MEEEALKVERTASTTKAFTKRLGDIGWRGTWSYVGFWLIVCLARWAELTALELNEVGDFLAGVFGPLAVFWLVLGYFQQGEELKQNTEALTLQVRELKSSVEQQRELVATTKEQVQIEKQKILTELKRVRSKSQPAIALYATFKYLSGENIHWNVAVTNHGTRCTQIEIYFDPESPVPSQILNVLPEGATIEVVIKTPIEVAKTKPIQLSYADIFMEWHTLNGFYTIQSTTTEYHLMHLGPLVAVSADEGI